MKIAINIVQSLLLPKLEKDNSFEAIKLVTSFWETITKALLDFETDAKPLYAAIYRLEIENPEVIISKLPTLYRTFITELAESYVLGEASYATSYLIETNNTTFQEQVTYFKTLENAIKKVERNRIKTELPHLFDKLTFDIPEETFEATIKRKSREDLRKKFKQWDDDLAQREAIPLEGHLYRDKSKDDSDNKSDTSSKTKIFQLNYMKYAVAASLVISLSIWFFNKPNTNFIMPSESLIEVSTISKPINIIQNKNFGFASKIDQVTIVEIQQQARVNSITNAIEVYQERIEKELNTQDAKAILAQLTNRIDTLQKELNLLKAREKQYRFDANEVNVYVSTKNNSYQVLELDSLLYLIKNKQLYSLTPSKNPIPYNEVQDAMIITQIDNLLFKNGLPTLND